MRWRIAVVALALLPLLAGQFGLTFALFTEAASITDNDFTTGSWQRLYLHNRPTPPTGDTLAQVDLTMDGTRPAATTLYNYDLDADLTPGRRLRLSGSGPAEPDLAEYVNWRTTPFSSPRSITGRAKLEIWSSANVLDVLKCGTLVAYLRDYDPTANTYAEISETEVSNLLWNGLDLGWTEYELTFSSVSYTIPAGHQLELKLITGSSSCRSLHVAFDTTTYESRLTLP